MFSTGISKIVLIAALVVGVGGAGLVIATKRKQPAKLTTVQVNPSVSPVVSPIAIPIASPSASQPKASPVVKTVPTPSPESTPTPSPSPSTNPNTPPLMIKSLPINLDYYDATTGKAGDLVFTKEKLQFNVLFTEFGFVIPGSQSATGNDKSNPQPTFQAPMGTKVHSLVDGVVVDMPTLYSNDYSVMVAPNNQSQWRYETEHVINPVVKVGDKVTAGQVVAEVSPHNKDGNAGYGLVEMGILKGGNPPKHLCPFLYLDPSVKDDIFKKLLAFYKSWEEYRGDTTLYNEAAQPTPGCLRTDEIEA